MSGKGSGRRPQQVDEDEATANWERIFGKKDRQPSESSEADESKGSE